MKKEISDNWKQIDKLKQSLFLITHCFQLENYLYKKKPKYFFSSLKKNIMILYKKKKAEFQVSKKVIPLLK